MLVLERLDALFADRADVVLETTLATRAHTARIRRWKAAGYRAERVYQRPPSADFSVMRVARRVAQGGHEPIPYSLLPTPAPPYDRF